MIIIPIEQSVTGIGNTIIGKENYLASSIRNLHFAYLNANGTKYTGTNNAEIVIGVSNEKALVKDDIRYALDLATVTLTPTEPIQVYNFFEDASINIICTVKTLVDGMITVFPSPIRDSADWR